MTQALESGTVQRIVQAADALFYQQGFEKTSLADIADQVKLSRGNFYYHFRTKDDILAAVIALRTDKTRAMLDEWAHRGKTPMARLRCFSEMLVVNRQAIQRHGCPVGTLCTELAKLAHPAQDQANMVFGQFRGWLRDQFEALGRKRDADKLAMHLLARSQGVATLANAFRDEAFIRHEVASINGWLQSLVAARPVVRKQARKTDSHSTRS